MSDPASPPATMRGLAIRAWSAKNPLDPFPKTSTLRRLSCGPVTRYGSRRRLATPAHARNGAQASEHFSAHLSHGPVRVAGSNQEV